MLLKLLYSGMDLSTTHQAFPSVKKRHIWYTSEFGIVFLGIVKIGIAYIVMANFYTSIHFLFKS